MRHMNSFFSAERLLVCWNCLLNCTEKSTRQLAVNSRCDCTLCRTLTNQLGQEKQMKGNVKLLDKIFPSWIRVGILSSLSLLPSTQLPCDDLLQDCSENNVYLWLVFSISFGESLNWLTMQSKYKVHHPSVTDWAVDSFFIEIVCLWWHFPLYFSF